jgi:hypothetical protein
MLRMIRPRCLTLVCSVLLLGLLGAAGAAGAAVPGPGWTIESFAMPTNFLASENAHCVETVGNSEPQCDEYQITATNSGTRATSEGDAVSIADTLPPGLTVQRVLLNWSGAASIGFQSNTDLVRQFPGLCSTAPLQCTLPWQIEPGQTVKLIVAVTVDTGTMGALVNAASVSGGGAAEASASATNAVSSTPAAFGVSSFSFFAAAVDGSRDTQAGDHPYEVTTTFTLNNAVRESAGAILETTSIEDPKDVVVTLPLGLVGSTLAAPQCTMAQLSSRSNCPTDTTIGHIKSEPSVPGAADGPIYNLVPEEGVPAEFGYIDILHTPHVFYVRVVPSDDGYVLQATANDIPQISLKRITVSFFGNPAARDGTGNAEVPMFTNPTDCSGAPEAAEIHVDSWQHPGRFDAEGAPDFSDPAWASATSAAEPITGCNLVQFTPQLSAQPTTHAADTPSGLEFELKLAQSEQAGTLATPALKRVVITLPPGFTVDPSAGDGLGACSEAQIGWQGPSALNFDPAPPQCPEASKIGSLELSTPLIPNNLTGAIYLAAQNANPFGSTLAAYVVVDDPVTGVLIKLAGEFLPDPLTGQLTAVFDDNPQLPFSDLKLHFFGGPRAELATPESCGSFTVASELTPWSGPDSGPAGTPFDSFPIDEGCVSGFAPSFTAGSTNLQAGAYSPFVASFSRSDTDQEMAGLSLTLPRGLLAKLTGVPLCSDADANAGTCPQATQVGTVQSGVGPGPNPLFVGGRAYLTGPYKGGPYGLSIVVPAVAGPFNFGTVVVRQSLRIDPHTAQVTDVSDPFPTIIDGIPLRLRRIDVTLDRPGFTFNPTNCAKQSFTGVIGGTALGSPTELQGTVGYATQPGATAPVTAPFQVTNCATLKFAPKFAVTTSGKTSRARGASLTATLSYPSAPLGSEANIARVKVDLPKQLPSRLTTLQKACTSAQFEANPAGCPSPSVIGHAVVRTPLLPNPLEGPAYFVSHGGEAFPSLTLVLQGDGVMVELVGTTFINANGITSTTFKTVPDVPFSTFTLTLPQGKYSALAANGNLCTSKLAMPTEFLAQNGAVIHQSTPVGVTGCAKPKALTRTQKLTKALKACRKEAKGKRAACEGRARKKLEPAKQKRK